MRKASTGSEKREKKRVTRKLKEVSRFSRAKQRQGNIQKCGERAKLFFAN